MVVALAKLAKGIGSLTLKQMRSHGTKTRINPDHIKIGGKTGLYYDRDLPFVTKHTYFSPKGSKTEGKKHTKYRLRERTESGEASGEDLITIYKTVGKNKRVPVIVKRKEARIRIDPKTGKKLYNLSHGRLEVRDKVITPLLKDIVNSPEKFGIKPTGFGIAPLGGSAEEILPIVNAVLKKGGHDPIAKKGLNTYLSRVQGKQTRDRLTGTDDEKTLHSFLREIDPRTGKERFNTISTTTVTSNPKFKHLSRSQINESRIRGDELGKLSRTDIGGKKTEGPLDNARRRVTRELKNKHPYLSKLELDAYGEQARIFLSAPQHKANLSARGWKEKYLDEDIDTVVKFIEDTDLSIRKNNPEMEKYMHERALNQLRTALSGDKYTMGHMRGTAADTWWFPGMEMSTIQIQKGDINRSPK